MFPGAPVVSNPVPVGLAVLAALSIASTSLGIRLGTTDGSATEALVVVLLCNALVLVPLGIIVSPGEVPLTVRSVLLFASAGLVGTLLGRVFYFESIARIGSSRTEPIKASQPLHATLVAVIVFAERVSGPHLAGIVLVVVGVGLVSLEVSRDNPASGVDSLRALLPGFAAALFFGLEPVFAKLAFAETDALFSGLAVRMAVATVAFLGYLWSRDALPGLDRFRRATTRWYVFAGVANTSFLVCYYAALQTGPVSLVVPLIQTSPLVVLVLSVVFLPSWLERVTWRLAAGASIVVVGAVLVTLFS